MLSTTAKVARNVFGRNQLIRRTLSSSNTQYLVEPTGPDTVGTLNYRIFFSDSQQPKKRISPWHDIPLVSSGSKAIFNLVVEIPRGTRAKMEIATKEAHNPISQDVKKGNLRFYGIDPVFNYGALPQTWEDPNVKDARLESAGGDNDPIDVVEVGGLVLPSGSIVQVKPIGVLCLLDEGEVDWKVLAINVNDPQASHIDDVADLEKAFPGKIGEVREWFRTYKTHEGKPLNKFGLNEECKNKQFALDVIAETHKHWEHLRNGRTDPGKLWIGQ